MKKEEESIRAMISSSDKGNSYLAACILRKNSFNFAQSTRVKLLSKISVEDRIKDYSDICDELAEKPLVIEDFAFLPEYQRKKALASAKLNQIAKLLNGKWQPNWTDTSENKWYPYFEFTGRGLVFHCSYFHDLSFDGLVVFKDEQTATFVGKTFIQLYEDLM